MVQLIRPRRFDPWLCELRDRIGGRPERFELCGADVTEVAVPSVLWGSGPELMQFSRVCAGPAAVVGTYRVQQVLCKGFDGCVLSVRRGCVEPGHEFSVGGAGGGEVLVAFFELKVGECQGVEATESARSLVKTSRGVRNPRIALGRSLSSSAIASR